MTFLDASLPDMPLYFMEPASPMSCCHLRLTVGLIEKPNFPASRHE